MRALSEHLDDDVDDVSFLRPSLRGATMAKDDSPFRKTFSHLASLSSLANREAL
jgi:hypothetical protein